MDKAKLGTAIKWGIGLAAVAIITPIIMLAVQGLVGIVIAGTLGLIIIHGAPVLSMKLTNQKLKMIKEEAEENPIETLESAMIQNRAAFQQHNAAVTRSVTARGNFKTKVETFKQKFPHRAAEFEAQLQRMTEAVEKQKLALKDAQASLDQGEHALVEMRAYWEMSQDMNAANVQIGAPVADVYAKMKADYAVDAVFASMNKSFAQLEVAAMLNENSTTPIQPAQLTNEPSATLEVLLDERTKVKA